ncbi:hypothetical protein Hamer_G021590 [Homarus americanus]|uniref:Uncharacterized protein n=1 Tax=Homarus americanus TaxID=6706 RepID=A0A8J5K4M3_HOMAM|nr:hypothetical protein Hamer_G021590 [Homarus americanus]
MPPAQLVSELEPRPAGECSNPHYVRGGRVLSARRHYNTVNAGPGLCFPQLWGDKHAGRGEKGAKPQGNASLLLLYLVLTTVFNS